MSIIIPANSAVSGGFTAANSLMFNSADSASLSRTMGTSTSELKHTCSMWFKRSKLSSEQFVWMNREDGSNRTYFRFNATDTISFQNDGGSSVNLQTTQKFRDVGAWYNIVIAIDTTQATSSNRVKIYINGVQITSFIDEVYPAEDAVFSFNNVCSIGNNGDGALYFGGYIAETVIIDGTQNAPTDFGEFDEDSGIWKPKSVSGLTFGNNGFYLDFQDSSALGNDAVGSNNFTANNLAATDQGIDTCTNNFCTMNPLDNYYSAATFSSGNNTVATAAAPVNWVASTFQVNKGKWYAECKPTAGTGSALVGFAGSTSKNSTQILETAGFFGGNYVNNGEYFFNGSGGAYAAAFSNGNIISVYLDLDNNFVYFAKNGTLQNSGDPTSGGTGTGGKAITAAASVTNGGYAFACGDGNTATRTFDWNFGSPYFAISSGNADGNGYGNFEYAVPSGYFALCTKNLAEYG